MNTNLEYLYNAKVGIPGLVVDSDSRYAIFNFGDVDHTLDKFDLIQSVAPGAQVIFNAYNDPYNFDYILQRITSVGIQDRCIVLIGDLEFAHQHRNVGFRYFSFVWHWWASFCHYVPVVEDIPTNIEPQWTSRTHRLSCLNRMPSYSRFATFFELQKKPWFNQVYSSFGSADLVDAIGIDYDIVLWFKQNLHKFPYSHELGYNFSNNWEVNVPAYADTYANLITETFSSEILVTEKTIKPLVSGNIIFVSATPYFLNQLRHMKFEVDFKGVNQGYDVIPLWRDRILAMVSEIDSIYYNIPDIWHENLSKLKYNREWALSTDFKNFLLHDVKDLFKYV